MSLDFAASSGLLDAVSAETAADFDTVVRLYRVKVFRFLFASLRDRETAENLTQECFLRAYRAQSHFRNDCRTSTWLMQIAVNLMCDHLKNRRFQFWKRLHRAAQPLEEELRACIADQQKSPEAQTLLKEQVQAVWDAAASLPERQRTVFLLRFVQDMDVQDIAIATGLQPATVKTHLFRALNSVCQRLGVAA
jgi:RNA polymerase sigma-70 factor (ECF subfamily)